MFDNWRENNRWQVENSLAFMMFYQAQAHIPQPDADDKKMGEIMRAKETKV